MGRLTLAPRLGAEQIFRTIQQSKLRLGDEISNINSITVSNVTI